MFHTIDSIEPVCVQLHKAGSKLVLATGFFDLLHTEHIIFLEHAKSAGDILIVAVESDVRARKIKGEGRPVETQLLRCQKVAQYADYVINLPDDFDNPKAFESLISSVRPDILAVSSHTAHQDKKRVLVEKYGGKLVVVYELNPTVSTTKIISNSMV